MTIKFQVLGTPAPKGSARAFFNKKTGRAFVAPGGAKTTEQKLKSWDVAVRGELLTQLGQRAEPVFVARPLHVELHFRMARPQGHWHPTKGGLKPSAPTHPATKPDIDKITRATLDSMTGLAFDDDSRIVSLVVSKEYADPGREGAVIMVKEIE